MKIEKLEPFVPFHHSHYRVAVAVVYIFPFRLWSNSHTHSQTRHTQFVKKNEWKCENQFDSFRSAFMRA